MSPGTPFPGGQPDTLPPAHRAFLDTAVPGLAGNPDIAAVLAAGSLATDTMDAHSDLDLVVGVEPGALDRVMARRTAIAETLGTLLAAFTGEHVGEPRLLICLYDDPLLHVDLKFVAVGEVGERTGPVRILFDRDGRAADRVRETPVTPLTVDRQWIEDRFWVWVHYAAGKVARGELMEALAALGMLRHLVLGPLLLDAAQAPPMGVRHIESFAPGRLPALHRTVAPPAPAACLEALVEAVALYRALRQDAGPEALERRDGAEAAAMEYVERTRGAIGSDGGPAAPASASGSG